MDNQSQHSLTLKHGASSGEVFPLSAEEIIIGREQGCEIRIEAPGVSRRHARLLRQGDAYLLEDLASTNGVFINDQRLSAPQRLKHADRVRLGQTVTLDYAAPLPPAGATLFEAPALRPDQTALEGPPARPDQTALEGAQPPQRPAERAPAAWSPPPPAYQAPTPPAYQPPPIAHPPAVGSTMLGDVQPISIPASPPQLVVAIAGEMVQTYSLTQLKIGLGRADDNQIVIRSPIVSRYHAVLERTKSGYVLSPSPEAGNPILLEGRPLTASHPLRHADTLRIGSLDPGLMVSLTYIDPNQVIASPVRAIQFAEKTLLQIGRDPSNDIQLDSPNVSRFHAQVERVGQRYRLVDLHSANGVFVNDVRVQGETWLQPDDIIRIGRHSLVMGTGEIGALAETRGLQVDSINLNKWVRKDLNILKNISLSFQPREFIVVVGQSGGGKSTLVDAIAGYRPATHGMVLVNGVNIYRNFEAVINDIGYVPQRDIIHYELTVTQALDYAARLRMPRDTSPSERRQRIHEVLDDLDLLDRKDTPISKLSGGQIKRVSIGVELLTKPGLFFLDEPTSGLDPGTETSFMHLMRRLADQGRTIVVVTHATKNVMLADKVVFLARGGFLAWFGPPEEALKYFDPYRSERDRRAKEMDFDQIYAILDDPSKGSAQDWAARYLQHPASQKYITAPLEGTSRQAAASGRGAPALATVREPAAPASQAGRSRTPRRARASALHQFLVLSARNLKILTRDRTSLVLMLLSPLLIGAIDFLLAPLMGRQLLTYAEGDASNATTLWFLLAMNGLLVGGFSQMREFIKEADVYKRERLVNLKIFPYVASKIWVSLLLALYQAAVFMLVRWFSFEVPGGQETFLLLYVTMALAILAGMMNGLLASAIAPAASSAPLLMILLIVPQIVLSGALAKIPDRISAIASTRWAFQGFLGLTGMGSDVSADPCWSLDDDTRANLSLDDKQALGCRCLGTAMFTPGSCNFPGLGKIYVAEIDQAPPVEPAALPPRPAEPSVPPAPQPPADKNDQLAMAKYLTSLQDYQDQVTQIQDTYRAQMKLYESQADLYQAQMKEYQAERLEFESARSAAVSTGESLIGAIKNEFGWTFVNKDDKALLYPWIAKVWGALGIIIVIYMLLILFVFKRKDS